jgi:hypothetical protein
MKASEHVMDNETKRKMGKAPNGHFLPGRSFNPGGRPKGARTFRSTLRDHLDALISETNSTELDEVIKALIASAKRTSRTGIEATKLIAAYTDGMPHQWDDSADGASAGGTVLVLPSNGREVPMLEVNEAIERLGLQNTLNIPSYEESDDNSNGQEEEA